MRIIHTIPHESLTISVFQMNDKYLVKFEAGPMEQVYKYAASEVGGLEGLLKKMSPEFIETVRDKFNDMFLHWKSVL